MKVQINFFILILICVTIASCSDDEKPKIPPTVTTGSATNVTTTTATVSGTITDNGNATITETGIVFSSNVAAPTTADNKVKLTDLDGNFSADLTGLSSGTKYNVRAYAINDIGTGYGDVINLTTGNSAPTITNLSVTGTVEINKTLTAAYMYVDAENDAEGATTFQWYAATSSTGTGETAIAGATKKTLVVQDAQNGKFIRVSVTPKAVTGTTTGIEVKSSYTGAVGAETVTFTYNGSTVTYGTIVSAASQRKWLDRNLGAKHKAQSATDYEAYGDLFQWGRLADGHQLVNRSDATDAGAEGVNGTTTNLSSIDVPATPAFIIAAGGSYDWRTTPNNNLWQGVNGTNNPCPTGWRLATKAEWDAEGITTVDDGFSKLGLTYTGYHDVADGTFQLTDVWGSYWSSTVSSDLSFHIAFFPDSFVIQENNRGNGYACRCIKD